MYPLDCNLRVGGAYSNTINSIINNVNLIHEAIKIAMGINIENFLWNKKNTDLYLSNFDLYAINSNNYFRKILIKKELFEEYNVLELYIFKPLNS